MVFCDVLNAKTKRKKKKKKMRPFFLCFLLFGPDDEILLSMLKYVPRVGVSGVLGTWYSTVQYSTGQKSRGEQITGQDT